MEAASVLLQCSPSSIPHGSFSRALSSSASRCCSSSSLAVRRKSSSLRDQSTRRRSGSGNRRPVMRWGGPDNESASSEERPETLFMRELAKRKKLGQDVGAKETDTKTKEEISSKPKFADERSSSDQRKRSLALNSEGLEGLVPRGQELVKLGGSFWLALWPLIAASLLAFGAAYLYFGPAFVHTGYRSSPPPYVDPYQLLESELLPPEVGPTRVPFNSFRSP